MSKRESITRYYLIIKKLKKSPSSFEEISDYLNLESKLQEYDFTVSKRTFQRDIQDIASFYNIEIQFNRAQKVYEIVNNQMESHEERLLETFDLMNALNYADKFANRLILEKRKPLGTAHFNGLLHSIENNVEVSFEYEKFWELTDFKTLRRVQPLALKEAQSRWYLIAKDLKDNIIKTFGLDRLQHLEITTKNFIPPFNYHPEKAFEHCIGIINDETKKPEKILLQFTPKQTKYIKSLPLHHSQKVISENPTGAIIEVFLKPTYDFLMELLSLGSEVKVLEPRSLKDEIKKMLADALKQY